MFNQWGNKSKTIKVQSQSYHQERMKFKSCTEGRRRAHGISLPRCSGLFACSPMGLPKSRDVDWNMIYGGTGAMPVCLPSYCQCLHRPLTTAKTMRGDDDRPRSFSRVLSPWLARNCFYLGLYRRNVRLRPRQNCHNIVFSVFFLSISQIFDGF